MSYGDHDECIGELVGIENEGLKWLCQSCVAGVTWHC